MQYREALRLKPLYFNAHYNLGNSLLEAGQTQEAVEHFEQAIRLKSNDPQARYNLGNALQQTGRLDDAIQQYQAAVRLKPDYAEAHNNLGSTLLRAGRPEEAIEQYQQAVQLRPNHPKAYRNLATAYAQLHRSSEAIAAAQKALDLARSTGQAELVNQIEMDLKTIAQSGQRRMTTELPLRAPELGPDGHILIPEGGAEGMIVTQGGHFGGYGLFLSRFWFLSCPKKPPSL